MNEHDLISGLSHLDGDPIEPPGQFREQLRLLILTEFERSVADPAALMPADAGREARVPGFDQTQQPLELASTPSRAASGPRMPRVLWAFAAGFAAALLLVGSIALLRVFTDGGSSIADLAAIHEDVGGTGLSSVFLEPTMLPDGLELEVARKAYLDSELFLEFAPADGSVDGERRELSILTTRPIGDRLGDTAAILDRLAQAYPDAEVAESTVRGQPAFVVHVGDASAHGWTTAVLVVESSQLLSETQGRNLELSDVLMVARGLTSISEGDFDEWSGAAIGWDLWLRAASDDPTSYTAQLEGLPGIESVQLRPQRAVSIVSVELQRSPSQVPATTVSQPPASDDAITPSRPVDVLVTTEPGADVEVVAAAIYEADADARIEYSPREAQRVTADYLDGVLSNAEVVNQTPAVYQPQPSSEPRFDTSRLGTEIPLVPATSATAFSSTTIETVTRTVGRAAVQDGEPAPLLGPFLHIGSVDGIRLFLGFNGDAEYVERVIGESGASASAASLGFYSYGETSVSSGPGDGYMTIRVPVESAVVSVDFPDEALWQRPIAGYALIPITIDQSSMPGTITAFDIDGDVLGRWHTWQ